MNISNTFPLQIDTLHHAYIVVGGSMGMVQTLLSEMYAVESQGNPDVLLYTYNSFGMEESRILRDETYVKSVGARKFFVIDTNSITEEAQNALLKIFEEPTPGTHFFICLPQDDLLPTLRSRVQIVHADNSVKENTDSFLKKNMAARLAIIKKITEDISDEKQTKQDAIRLLNQVESELYAKGVEKMSDALRVCQLSRASLYDRGAPVKMILEQMALSV